MSEQNGYNKLAKMLYEVSLKYVNSMKTSDIIDLLNKSRNAPKGLVDELDNIHEGLGGSVQSFWELLFLSYHKTGRLNVDIPLSDEKIREFIEADIPTVANIKNIYQDRIYLFMDLKFNNHIFSIKGIKQENLLQLVAAYEWGFPIDLSEKLRTDKVTDMVIALSTIKHVELINKLIEAQEIDLNINELLEDNPTLKCIL